MPTDEDDSMAKVMQLASQFLPTVVLSQQSKIWSDTVLALLRTGIRVEEAIGKADLVLTEHRLRFGADKLKDSMLENMPARADLRAIR